MEQFILKKESFWYYTMVSSVFLGFGAMGGIMLVGSYLFWPLMLIMVVCLSFALIMKDGRYHELYSDRLVIVQKIPLQVKKEIRTINYDDIDDISYKNKADGSGGEGYRLHLKSGETYILYTGFISRPNVDRAIHIIKNGNPILLLNKEARESVK